MNNGRKNEVLIGYSTRAARKIYAPRIEILSLPIWTLIPWRTDILSELAEVIHRDRGSRAPLPIDLLTKETPETLRSKGASQTTIGLVAWTLGRLRLIETNDPLWQEPREQLNGTWTKEDRVRFAYRKVNVWARRFYLAGIGKINKPVRNIPVKKRAPRKLAPTIIQDVVIQDVVLKKNYTLANLKFDPKTEKSVKKIFRLMGGIKTFDEICWYPEGELAEHFSNLYDTEQEAADAMKTIKEVLTSYNRELGDSAPPTI